MLFLLEDVKLMTTVMVPLIYFILLVYLENNKGVLICTVMGTDLIAAT